MLVLPSLPWDERESRDTDASEQQTSHPAEGSETGAETDSAGDVGQSVDYVETDAERVLKILNRHDGRIRQAQLVEVNDWSESKVSRLLSEMESNGLVSKVTIGRENIVTLPGEEPTSGFDDDR